MRRFLLLPLLCGTLALLSGDTTGQQKKDKKATPKKPQFATPAESLKVAKGFRAELLYSVPKETQGSWVNLCVDPKGRIITSDQYGPLYRITPPPVGEPGEAKVERIPADIGDAQGMLWAFDALYVVVNSGARKSGLYRVTDSDGDDMPDKVELLREIGGGGGEHGPHAVLLHPDGKQLTIVCGNQSKMVKTDSTRPVPIWGEDHLLPRMPDGRGFMRGVMGPGGAIYNCSPDGKTWELLSVGYRNEFDAAYNRNGDLFTYDADMEWDFNTPWYRPTRVCLATSGAEFGWRNGAGKYPPYYADNLPGLLDIGPGSPTGVAFGYGAKFPAKYQDALFICDWSYGKLYAVHLTPSGSSYAAVAEEFVGGTPLPLTDVVVNPKDGCLYFAIGGRKTQSGLYRISYTGSESTATSPTPAVTPERAERARIEAFHKTDPAAVEAVWPALASTDRYTRFAARVALEHQPVASWRAKALADGNITALLALTRASAVDPLHAKSDSPKADPAVRAEILAALAKHDFAKLSTEQQLDLIRVHHILLNRFGAPTAAERDALLAKFEPAFPVGQRFVDGELSQLLVYLESATVAAKAVKLLLTAPTQEEQMEYARALRVLKSGWTPELRKQYFTWVVSADNYKGGASFGGFVKQIKDDAVATLTAAEKVALKPVLDMKAAQVPTGPPRPLVKAYKMDDLTPKLEAMLAGGRDYEKGKKLFAEAKCAACHRYDSDGGVSGPDLTQVGGRFSPKDLLESIVFPDKEISDQYAAVEIETEDGKKIIGRIVNLNGDTLNINTNMLDPNGQVSVNRNNIASMKTSKTSMMPGGTLDTLKEDEVYDLLAYILARADKKSKMFSR